MVRGQGARSGGQGAGGREQGARSGGQAAQKAGQAGKSARTKQCRKQLTRATVLNVQSHMV